MVERANINPAMMLWARKRAGYINGFEEDLPKDIKSKYKSWESGEEKPTWTQLRKASKKFCLPSAFFFLEKGPEDDDFPKMINYRKLDADDIFENNSPSLIKQIRKSQSRREHYLDLLYELEENIPSFEIYEGSLNKKHVSNYIREKLGISLETQKTWIRKNKSKDSRHYNFLNKWKEIITRKIGVLIFESEGVALNEMRGLCIFHKEVPIILLNGKDSVNGRIFSLFNELTHLLLGQSAICGDDEDIDEEIFCNAVAGEFLVPNEDLCKNTNADNMDTISNGAGGNYLNNQIKYNGEPYCAVVLEAYEKGIINGGEFSRFTNLNKKFIPFMFNRYLFS